MIAGLRVDDLQHGPRDVAALPRSMPLCGADNKQEHEMSFANKFEVHMPPFLFTALRKVLILCLPGCISVG